ncbi:MAG: hypothetical protein H5U24_13805 [Thioclava marina]|uniref:hypothetical protein n=1 Tax=Thioclava TaxID=285107 RepID=UPI0012E008DD|nr:MULTISPECIES: hypothetical protein [Thioclava]MBC7146459.1 hypothetical protein [Thioclava marina]
MRKPTPPVGRREALRTENWFSSKKPALGAHKIAHCLRNSLRAFPMTLRFQNERSVEISVKKTLANFYFWRKKNDPHFSRDRGFDRAAASMRLIE